MSCMVNPAGPSPSLPVTRPMIMASALRVRSDRGVPVSPMIRANPVSGCAGLDSQKLSLEFSTKSRRCRLGSSAGPKIPGVAESGSVPQAQADREPSSTGSPATGKISWPSAVSQAAASASVTSGIAPMSA